MQTVTDLIFLEAKEEPMSVWRVLDDFSDALDALPEKYEIANVLKQRLKRASQE